MWLPILEENAHTQQFIYKHRDTSGSASNHTGASITAVPVTVDMSTTSYRAATDKHVSKHPKVKEEGVRRHMSD